MVSIAEVLDSRFESEDVKIRPQLAVGFNYNSKLLISLMRTGNMLIKRTKDEREAQASMKIYPERSTDSEAFWSLSRCSGRGQSESNLNRLNTVKDSRPGMHFRCELMRQSLLPVFRSLLASQLVEKYGFSQAEVARRLGITQAAVSQYLHEKRAKRTLGPRSVTRKVEKVTRRIALQISQNKISSGDAMKMACRLCAEIAAIGGT